MFLDDIVGPMGIEEAKATKQRLDPKCWKGKHKEGTKVKGGVRVNNCVPNESVEEAIAPGVAPQRVGAPGTGNVPAPNDAQIKKMIWDALKIDAPTGQEALQQAIVNLTKRPQTPMVQNMLGKISMIADRMNIGPEYRALLNKFAESIEEDSWSSESTTWGGQDPFHGTGDQWANEAVIGGTQTPPAEADIKKIIWNTLHIDKPTAKESIEAAISLLAGKPQTRTVQQLLGHLSALVARSKIQINPMLSNILNTYTESQLNEYPTQGPSPDDSISPIHGGLEEDFADSPVAGAIVRRIMMQRPDLLKQYGPELVGHAVDEVADYVGDVDEIGSSDVSGWVNQVERMLKENPPEAFSEGAGVAYTVTYFDTKSGDQGESTVSALTRNEASDKIVQLMHERGYDVTVTQVRPSLDEGYQDFNKVEPYEVCLAGKPVKQFDYYEDARRFHDNWKKKLYNQGEQAKADKITLNPIIKEMDKSQKGAAGWNIDDYPLGAKGTTVKPTTKKKVVKDMTKLLNKAFAKEKEIKEFAPSPERDDNSDDRVPNDLHKFANLWWNAADPKLQEYIADQLATGGWTIQQVDYDHVLLKHREGTEYVISDDTFDPDLHEDAGTWIVYDPETKQIKKRFKTHTAGKSYAKVHNLGFASSEYYFDNVKQAVAEDGQVDPIILKALARMKPGIEGKGLVGDPVYYAAKEALAIEFGLMAARNNSTFINYLNTLRDMYVKQNVKEAETDYSKRRQRERDIDAGKPVAKQRQPKMTDYQKRRAQDKKDMELGEAGSPAQQAAIAIAMKKAGKEPKTESVNYWTKLQAERSTKLNTLINELNESIKDVK